MGTIDSSRRDLWFKLTVALIVSLLTARFLSVRGDYPYYFIWDMDFVVTLDSILIQSGLLPDHLNHTAFGMNLLLAFSEKIARAWDALSVLTLEDLSSSLNPVAGVAELTDFIRSHSPFVAVGITLALWGAICLLLRPGRLWSLLLLLMLGTQESLVYHSAMVRTEFYAVLFWSGAVLALALALRSAERHASVHVFLAGILMGLAFLTKLQILFYVAALPVFLLFGLFSARSEPAGPAADPDRSRRRALLAVGAGLFNAMFFPLLLLAAARATLPEGVGVFSYDAKDLDLAPYAVLLLVLLWGLFAAQCVLLRRSRTGSAAFGFLGWLAWMTVGFHFAFLLHFLVFADPGRSLDYLLYDAKMLFFRGSYLEPTGLGEYLSNLKALFLYNPVVIVSHAASLLLLVAGRFGKFISVTRRELAAAGLLSAAALVALLLGTRWVLRDVLFLEILLNTLTLIYLTVAALRSKRWSGWVRAGTGAALLLLVAANLHHGASMPIRIDANYNLYGWWEGRWLTNVYRANHVLYRDVMQRRYAQADATAVMAARRQARQHHEVRRTASFVFKNQATTLRNVGLLWEGLPVWVSEPEWVLQRIPEELRGAIVVDSASVEPRRRHALDPATVTTHSENMDKLTEASPRHLVILKRRDLRIFLFAPAQTLRRLEGTGLVRGPSRPLTVRSGVRTLELGGVEIVRYAELPLETLGNRFFFVIRRT